MRMLQHKSPTRRRGVIIPLVALCLVGLLGMIALAIDIGMVAVAKTQCQNAADSAATATVRTFTGQSGNNLTNAPINGVKAAVANQILGTNVVGNPSSVSMSSTDVYTSGQVTIKCGGYYYIYSDSNPSTEAFNLVVPGKDASQPYTAAIATIQTTAPTFFGTVFGTSSFNVQASASAAYRPRDIVLAMDLSGSMRFESLPGVTITSGTTVTEASKRTISLFPDPSYPTFGHYSATASAALQGTTTYESTDVMVLPNNLTYQPTNGSPAIIADYMSSGTTPAFTAATTSYATTPGGDNYLQVSGTYVKTVADVIGTTPTVPTQLTWARTGYQGNTGTAFNGYTAGPNYWGKTFFIWPPDPKGSDLDPTNTANHANNGANDWRQRFFFKVNSSTGNLYWLDQNSVLFNTNGAPNSVGNPVLNKFGSSGTITTVTENGQSVTYYCLPNYAAIFQWLKNQSPTHFPSSMLTGKIQYYSKIPDPTGDSSFNSRFWTQSPMTDLSERFWKDYVDFMLGHVQTGAGTYTNTGGILGTAPFTAMIGNGDMFAWGTTQISQKQDCDYVATINNSGGYTAGYNGSVVMNGVQTASGGTTSSLPGIAQQTITAATNATPIQITTSSAHGLTVGQPVYIAGVQGNTAANGSFLVGSRTGTTFTLTTSSGTSVGGNGAYTSGGIFTPGITAATSASPIQITTAANHNLSTGQFVSISGVAGNTAANGLFQITKVSSTQFTLNNSTGNGTFSSSSSTPTYTPVYFARFGGTGSVGGANYYGSTFYSITPTAIGSGTLTGNINNSFDTNQTSLNQAVANSSSVQLYVANYPYYMDSTITDNPYRPKHQFWFGPQTWLDWLGNYSTYCYYSYKNGGTYSLRWAGNTHESQSWSCKVGLNAAITDIQNNHPSDYIGMAFFSNPYDSKQTTYPGFYNGPLVSLGQNYTQLQNSLWFPPTTVTGTATSVTPYDTDFLNVPRAQGGTAPGMALMLAYNMFSSSVTNLRTYSQPSTTYRGYSGGLGRQGAQRLVIFETDGAPNWQATATLAGSGTDSYYPVRLYDPTNIANNKNEYPTTTGIYANTQVYNIISQICAQTTASPPGFSTSRKPVQVYAIGYGSLFDPANSTLPNQSTALTFLQSVQYYGGTSSNTSGSSFPSSQLVYGSPTNRSSQLQAAIDKILVSTVPVSILQ